MGYTTDCFVRLLKGQHSSHQIRYIQHYIHPKTLG